jgi:hypothetical protein
MVTLVKLGLLLLFRPFAQIWKKGFLLVDDTPIHREWMTPKSAPYGTRLGMYSFLSNGKLHPNSYCLPPHTPLPYHRGGPGA